MNTPHTSPIALLDTVALICDLPDHGLIAGEVGAVVEVLASDVFEVEFCDENGQTYAFQTLRANQIVALHNHGHPLRAMGREAMLAA